MEKTATVNLRVNPIAKQRAESVLKQLGIPMSTAMDMYLNQIALVDGIPFPVLGLDKNAQNAYNNVNHYAVEVAHEVQLYLGRPGKDYCKVC